MTYGLLDAFRETFDGRRYLHRNSSLGDFIAMHLYEDLYSLRKAKTYCAGVKDRARVLNVQNRRRGVKARRGDGTFGELIPDVTAITDHGFHVARGPIATVEIGTEVKILAKAMIKQIDRVVGDLTKQVAHFRHGGGNPICVAVVGVNHASVCTSYEGDRAFMTDSKNHRHPIQEATDATTRLLNQAKPEFDEFLVLPYRATNVKPFPFEWVNEAELKLDYGAILTRISREYERRFRNGNGS